MIHASRSKRFVAPVCVLVGLAAACQGKAPEPPVTVSKPAATETPARKPPSAPDVPPPADVKTPPATAQKFPNGIAMVVATPGTGTDKAGPDDVAQTKFDAWNEDGKHVMGSGAVARPLPMWRLPEPLKFPLLQMVVGETAQFWLSPDMSPKGVPPDRAPRLIQFSVVSLEKGSAPPATPADVKAPPADAKTFAAGLAIKVLKPGTGTEHPKATDQVLVNYTGWTTDGKMFDSSHGHPMPLGLNQVIQGWTEGVQQMVAGETARLWIPEKLAYGGRPGAPAGMLVFDIELVKIGGPPPLGGAGSPKPASTAAH